MTFLKPAEAPLNWSKSLLYAALAIVCFQVAYTSTKYPLAGLFIFGYAYGLVRLTDQPSVRRAFYFGLAVGFLAVAPQAGFFWSIFSVAAIVLWLVFAFWIGLFTAIICGCIRRWGKVKTMWLIPVVWTGLEYFRSELYYLKFSWLNIGYVSATGSGFFGMFGVGFLVIASTAVFSLWQQIKMSLLEVLAVLMLGVILFALTHSALAESKSSPRRMLSIAGIQMEFPPVGILPQALNKALLKNPDAQIFVLSEYTLDGPVPDSLKDWCREHSRFLVVGGKDFVTNDVYYNTAFVVGTNGDIVFKQAKSVPIQFFHDGLPAPKQEVWNSPWGKIGICICYDLSYTRVTDELVRQGAQLLIVPTMDVAEWGKHQHELHGRVAPVRAAEYGIPIFRLASSGISQAVTGSGTVIAQTKFPGNGDILAAKLRLPTRGSLPLDRYLAPLCVVMTGAILFWLIFISFRQKFAKGKSV
jgi:apolipoprotein N-acyltransferase